MTDPGSLERQHAQAQSQDEDTLGEVVRLLISSAEGYEEAASLSVETEQAQRWRREADERWALARQVQSWLRDRGYLAPKEGLPLGSTHRGVLDMSAGLRAGDAAARRTIELGEAALRRRVSALRRQSDLSASAMDLMCFVDHQIQAES